MSTRMSRLNEINYFHGICTPRENEQQRVAVGAVASQSGAIGVPIVVVYANTACWVSFGTNPTAVANDGSAVFIPAGLTRTCRVNIASKISVIRDTADGYLYVSGGE